MSEDRSNFTDDRWRQDRGALGFSPSDNPSGSDTNWSLEDAQWADSHTRSKQEALAKLQAMASTGTSEPLKFGAGGSINPAWFTWQQNQRDLNYAKEDAQAAKDKQDYQDWQIKQRMIAALSGDQKDEQGRQDTNKVSDKLLEAGAEVSKIDPIKGIEIFKQGQDFKTKAAASQLEDLRIKDSKMTVYANTLATVMDEDSFQKARKDLAGLGPGFEIPEAFQKYDYLFQNWADKRVDFSPKAQALLKAKIAEQKASLDDIATNLKINADLRAERDLAIKEKKAQEPNIKTPILSGKQLDTLGTELSKFIPDVWDKADSSEDKDAAVSAWTAKVAELSKTLPPDQAKLKAAQIIKSQFNADGVFVPSAGSPVSGSTLGRPTYEQWKAAVSKDNPNATEAEFKANYNKRFGL